jgi:hypothetical protein
MTINRRTHLCTLLFLAIIVRTGWAQTHDEQPLAEQAQSANQQTTPEPDDMPQAVETPSASSLDLPSIDSESITSRSYLLLGMHVGESADSNPYQILNNSTQLTSGTQALGSISLLKLLPRSQTTIDYVGGGTFYEGDGIGSSIQQLHRLDASQRLQWRRGQLTFSDSFSYLHGDDFGFSSFGGASAYNLRFPVGSAGIPADTQAPSFDAPQLNNLTQGAYITNVSAATVTEALSPRCSGFLGGNYSITDYFGSTPPTVNGRQMSSFAGYDYQLSRRDQIGLEYGYRTFVFPGSAANNIFTNAVQFVYRRHVSARMQLVLGAGPELTKLSGGSSGNSEQINATVHASLQYHPNRSYLSLSYDRLVTSGFGFVAGGNSDIVRFSVGRHISRYWQTSWDAGYARVDSFAPSSPAVGGNSYAYGFAGAAVQRRLGQHSSAFASYQFSDENLESFLCSSSLPCAGTTRHIAAIGFDWHFRPISLE